MLKNWHFVLKKKDIKKTQNWIIYEIFNNCFRNFKIVNENYIGDKSELSKMIRFFRSDSFFHLLSRMTSIRLCRDHCWKTNAPCNIYIFF